MFRRHPYLTAVGLAAALLLLACGVFLATFDLNRYRESLQDSLSKALSRPVRLGEARLSWRFGPLFDFVDLEIRSQAEEPALLQVNRLYLKPKILPMLMGRINFSEILLDTPQLAVSLSSAGTPSPPNILHTLLTTIDVDSMTIRHGSLKIIDRRRPDSPFELELRQVQMRASHLFSEDRGRLRLEAQVAQAAGSALFKLGGRLALRAHPQQWPQARYDLELMLQGWEPGPLVARYGSRQGISAARGQLAAQLTLVGAPAEGIRIEGGLTGDNLALQLPELYNDPLSLKELAFSGLWTVGADVYTLEDFSLRADELRLNGHLTLQRNTNDPWLEGILHTPDLSLQEIWRLLPDRLPVVPEQALSSRLPEGRVRLVRARFAGPLASFGRSGSVPPLKEAELQMRDCRLDLKGEKTLRDLSADLALADGSVNVTEGRGILLDAPLQFSGRVERPFEAGRKTTVGAAWMLPAARLGELLPEGAQKYRLSGEGPIPLSLTVEGEGPVFHMNIGADLDACRLTLPPLFHKATGTAGKLEIVATLSPDRLQIDGGRLSLGSATLTVTGERLLAEKGEFLPAARQPFRLRCELAPTELAGVTSMLPPLKKYRIRGQVAGHYALEGTGFTVRQATGNLTAANAGVHFGDVLKGALHGFSGRANLHRDRVEWADITGHLGDSPVRISGKVGNWSSPRTELVFAADRLRAADLFFPSPRAMFRGARGRLIFTTEEVLFDDIEIALETAPPVIVNGRLRFGPVPTTTLDIAARQANIDDVVALWEGPTETRPAAQRQRSRVIVHARADRGTYGPLEFRKAEGTVTATADSLRIEPLQFTFGGGSCRGQVALLKNSDGDPQLDISGHLENVSADRLHRLASPDRETLLNGTVSGAFALQGRAGDRFLESSTGKFRITIKEGVLYRFAFLSKVFSLLNVSQILTLKLPDMAREGMPFDKLEASAALDRGLLTTEDLFLTSNAMNLSLVGTANLVSRELDLKLGIKPFRTVDTIITRIPIAGWLLTGEEKALITAHFEITGKSDDPEVRPIPVTSLSSQVLGIFKRILGLPGKAITDPAGLIMGEDEEKETAEGGH